jgi:hypothetical protein
LVQRNLPTKGYRGNHSGAINRVEQQHRALIARHTP